MQEADRETAPGTRRACRAALVARTNGRGYRTVIVPVIRGWIEQKYR